MRGENQWSCTSPLCISGFICINQCADFANVKINKMVGVHQKHAPLFIKAKTLPNSSGGNNIKWKISSLSILLWFHPICTRQRTSKEVAAHTESLFYEAYLMERSLRSIEFPDLFAATASKDAELRCVANQISVPRRKPLLCAHQWTDEWVFWQIFTCYKNVKPPRGSKPNI